MASRGKTKVTTSMRAFRIALDDPDHFEDNWNVFMEATGREGAEADGPCAT